MTLLTYPQCPRPFMGGPANMSRLDMSFDRVFQHLARDRHLPWRVLATCALIKQTRCADVVIDTCVKEFFRIVTEPEAMLHVAKADVDHVLRPLNFHQRRFAELVRMTAEYQNSKPLDKLFGVDEDARRILQSHVWNEHVEWDRANYETIHIDE